MYQRQGSSAFKKDLSNIIALCDELGRPQDQFKSIHVAGTNGKGSTSHMIAAMLQQAGYRVGLYTSPHLKDFRERIRINGQMITESSVVNFIAQNKAFIEKIQPSFFEMTVAMAFDHFAKQEVDVAVVEVGLGGRLDSTNIISPELSVITNIGYDHMEMLGDTLQQIAAEKAGIIKQGVPVVVGEYQNETFSVFEKYAQERETSVQWAADLVGHEVENWQTDLRGSYQHLNKVTAMAAVCLLHQQSQWDFDLQEAYRGLQQVVALTGLKGRWQELSSAPLTLCDTGHNGEAFDYLLPALASLAVKDLWMVLGFVNDKNIADLLERLPKDAHYIFTQAQIPRAMPLDQLKRRAQEAHLEAHYISDVNEALAYAQSQANKNDVIFIGGSTFVVAEIEGL